MTDNTQDWRTMTAGKELDELIAHRLGYRDFQISGQSGLLFATRDARADDHPYSISQGAVLEPIPEFSTDTDAALWLLKDVCADIFLNPENNFGCEVGNTKFRFDFNLCFRRHIGTGNTVALAVCRAWLAMQDELAK